MKNYKQILEAINRGIKFALDDFDDNELQGQVNSKVSHQHGIGEYIDFMKDVIDLGLPSGTCWFKYNFGCDIELLDNNPNGSIPEDWVGNYYAWGELEPKYEYTRDNYKFYVRKNWKLFLTKYCNMTSDGFNSIIDNFLQLQPEDDVVYQNFVSPTGIKFNIPTKDQFIELVKNTIKEEQTNFNGVKGLNGLLYTSKINGNSIFFPNTGNYDGSSHEEKNLVTLWTANISIINNSHYATYFYGISNVPFAANTRFCGYPVRPVCKLN